MAQTLIRKRPRADESLPDHISKSSKSSGTARGPSNFPPEFYDSLPFISLTPRALRELDRRNENLPPSEPKPAVGFVKPRGAKLAALAKLGVSEYAQFASTGGPDLSDLKGVCARIYFICQSYGLTDLLSIQSQRILLTRWRRHCVP